MTLDHSISKPLPGAVLRVLSMGAGVQSSTLAMMSARGDLPMLDAAIFSDTGWEPAAVYRWLDWLEPRLPFPLIRVRKPGPDLGEHALAVARGDRPLSGSTLPPWFLSPDGQHPKHCNADYKRDTVTREVRRLLTERGIRPKGKPIVEMWIGMSTDELERLKDHRRKYVAHRWPLLEVRLNRGACLQWWEERQMPQPPKSSCIFCPYRGNRQWRDLRDNAPEDWAKVVEFDRLIRPFHAAGSGQAFVHRQRRPLDECDLQDSPSQGDLFNEECDGVCGS